MPKKTFFCVDAHTCGNPVRVVAGGGPDLKGDNMLEKRKHFLEEYDWIRTGLMFEPRGHDMMSGSILYPPHDEANDVAVLFIETSGCLPMCGHGTIGTITIAVEEGLITPKVPGKIRMETPAGLVLVEYTQVGNKVKSVKLTNVPAFLYKENLEVESPDLGMLTVDVAYGGNFYAIVDPQKNFSGIQDFTASQLAQYSPEIRKRLNEKYEFVHPEDSRINGLSHLLWTGDTLSDEADARNAVFYGDKAIDRSPCGTGTSARMAQWVAKGKLKKGDTFVHESVIGSKFVGKVEDTLIVEAKQKGSESKNALNSAESTGISIDGGKDDQLTLESYPAIIPSIEGWARVTGYNNIFIDPEDDPYAHGFQVI
ncbi:hydroxyproline-2-epimerase [Fulvitalea axinellae]|uniref:Hydroxyproline-2-epimerase n=1 Tax=Fulvitalea axinellae TaxID=1182444 RepID=A0AAU9CRS7_9BACT|nr:hydroxyproline-2-epimerase [Fulvitalea axinellae]